MREEGNRQLNVLDRFLLKVEKTNFCWNWLAQKDAVGYGTFWMNRKRNLAHRISYELHVGPIPEGLTIDHLCRNPSCVNPEHMQPVSLRENILRGNGPAAINSRKTVCKNGHPLEGDTVRRDPKSKKRTCTVCLEAAHRRYQIKHPEIVKERSRRWREAHRAEESERQGLRYLKMREQILARGRERYRRKVEDRQHWERQL